MADEPRERLLSRLGGSAPIGLAALDPQLRYVAVNDWLAELNGGTVEAHLGKTVRDVIPELADQLEPIMREIFAGGEPVYGVPVAGPHHLTGEMRFTEASFFGLDDAKGRRMALGCVVVDTTARERALSRGRPAPGRDHDRDRGRRREDRRAGARDERARSRRRARDRHRVRDRGRLPRLRRGRGTARRADARAQPADPDRSRRADVRRVPARAHGVAPDSRRVDVAVSAGRVPRRARCARRVRRAARSGGHRSPARDPRRGLRQRTAARTGRPRSGHRVRAAGRASPRTDRALRLRTPPARAVPTPRRTRCPARRGDEPARPHRRVLGGRRPRLRGVGARRSRGRGTRRRAHPRRASPRAAARSSSCSSRSWRGASRSVR